MKEVSWVKCLFVDHPLHNPHLSSLVRVIEKRKVEIEAIKPESCADQDCQRCDEKSEVEARAVGCIGTGLLTDRATRTRREGAKSERRNGKQEKEDLTFLGKRSAEESRQYKEQEGEQRDEPDKRIKRASILNHALAT